LIQDLLYLPVVPLASRAGLFAAAGCIDTFTIAAIPARIAGGRLGHAARIIANSGSVGVGGVAGGWVETESRESAPHFTPLSSAPSVFAVFLRVVRVQLRPLSRISR